GPGAVAIGEQQLLVVVALYGEQQAAAVGHPDGGRGAAGEIAYFARQAAGEGCDVHVTVDGKGQPLAVGRPLRRFVGPVGDHLAVGGEAHGPATGGGHKVDVGEVVAVPDEGD